MQGDRSISAHATYAADNGWASESGGMYQLANSRGYDAGAKYRTSTTIISGSPGHRRRRGSAAAMKFGRAGSASTNCVSSTTP
jgi:hypothetical protein